jgi:hypothetical protein
MGISQVKLADTEQTPENGVGTQAQGGSGCLAA